MNSTLPGQVRPLFREVLKALAMQLDPGILRSNNFARDCRACMCWDDRVYLSVLPKAGKSIDACIIAGEEETIPAKWLDCLRDTSVHEGTFRYFIEPASLCDPLAIRALRQVLHLFSKLEWGNPPIDEHLDAFVERNESLPTDLPLLWRETSAATVWWHVCHHIDWTDIIPRHGPGAVATGEKPWEKMRFKRIYRTLDELYPVCDYFFLNASHLCDELQTLQKMQLLEYPTTKMVAVPKDFRGPRLISAEPLETQWIQQGQARLLMGAIEHHRLTAGFVNFTDQTVNQRLALRASCDQSFSTIDLKDASDRVSIPLCKGVMDWDSFRYLSASRSHCTMLPNGVQVQLKMFSPMGSAVCFPVESLIFYSLVLGAIHRENSRSRLTDHLGAVFVYGDDIVVRSEYTDLAIHVLEAAGLKVNSQKTCRGPRFRESCGVDAYLGWDVTPIRIKHLPCRRSPSTLAGSSDHINAFRAARMETCATMFQSWTEEEFGLMLPKTTYSLPCSIKETSLTEATRYNLQRFKHRYNASLMREEYQVTQLSPLFHQSSLPCWCEAFRSILLCTHGDERGYPVPRRVRLTKRWIPA